jgi:RHS repeat-associated protein
MGRNPRKASRADGHAYDALTCMYDSLHQHVLFADKFTGKERDSESGLDNFGARFNASNFGRFTSPDDFWKDSNVADPQSWNKYAYSRNNPLKYVGPTGEEATATVTGCSKDNDGHQTCNVNVTATIAIYSVNGTSADQLKQAQSALTSQIDQAWSGSFTQDGTTYNVTTSVSVTVVDSEKAGVDSKAQNVIGVDASGKTGSSHVEAGGKGYDKGVFDFSQIKAGGFAAHEFSHLLGLDDNHGNVLSNSFNPAVHPGMKATDSDFQWAFGPEFKAGNKAFTVGQREGYVGWGNNRGNRKWWEGYASRSTNN